MADETHLAKLKEGVEVWNAWRKANPKVRPNLQGADLTGETGLTTSHADLRAVNFCEADLSGAKLWCVDFTGADLRRATLIGADLADQDPIGNCDWEFYPAAELSDADLREADLSKADLGDVSLAGARLGRAKLRETILHRAVLTGTDLTGADLTDADLGKGDPSFKGGATLAGTIFGDVDLSTVKGLAEVDHRAPSILGTGTLAKSKGRIPEVFLKGCGLADWEIENAKLYTPDLSPIELADIQAEVFRLYAANPIQISSVFISYSNMDTVFVEAIERQFDSWGIRYWRDVHNMKAGRVDRQIERAITLNPTVLIVLSENSVGSPWVEWEVEQAQKLERKLKRDILCPVALDDSWKTCAWSGPLRSQVQKYHILDFSTWQQAEAFQGQCRRLIDGLQLFYVVGCESESDRRPTLPLERTAKVAAAQRS
jgi:uncharacterized protein YjbI with pentapeptide repeats